MAHPDERDHAAADAGGARGADLARVGGALAGAVGDGVVDASRGAAGVGQVGVSATGTAVARVRAGAGDRTRRRGSRRRRRAAEPARNRRVHRPRRGLLRLRTASSRGGYQCSTRCRARGARPRAGEPVLARSRGDRSPAARPGAARRDLLGGPDGAGRPGLHGPQSRLRPLPAAQLRVGRGGQTRRRGGPQGAEVRGHRPSGSWTAARCTARRLGPGRADPPRPGLDPRSGSARAGAGFVAGRRADRADR